MENQLLLFETSPVAGFLESGTSVALKTKALQSNMATPRTLPSGSETLCCLPLKRADSTPVCQCGSCRKVRRESA